MFALNKLSLIIVTRCNLRCKLCCEYVPQHKPFPDMTIDEERRILDAAFEVCDHIETLHLTGGGEPFLHPQLPEMIDLAMRYGDKFDKLMLFTNCHAPFEEKQSETMLRHRDKLFVQLSRYGVKPEREAVFAEAVKKAGIPHRVRKYYGDDQSFGGWVSFGPWEKQNKPSGELEERFANCAVTDVMRGNWRTRDGKVHWCSRSQRGMELGLLPENPDDYVDLLDSVSVKEKRDKFRRIAASRYISACDCCSGDQGTSDGALRFPAAEQM
jgi:hypothetical protein